MTNIEIPPLESSKEPDASRIKEHVQKEKKNRILAEVIIVYGVVLLLLGIYSRLPWSLIREYGVLVAAALFLYLPILLLQYRRFSFKEYGLTLQPLGKSLKFYVILSILVFSLFGVGYFVIQKFQWCVPLHVPPSLVQCLPKLGLRPPLPTPIWLWVANTLLLVALPEECFFRGYLQGRIAKLASPYAAVIITSVLFALGHVVTSLHIGSLLIFFPSLLFGWLRLKTGAVLASILFHASCNVFIVLLHSFM